MTPSCVNTGRRLRGVATALALALLAATVGARAAHADDLSTVLRQMAAAVNAAHSYALSMDMRDSDQPGVMHEDGIVVRRDGVTQTYMKVRENGETIEIVSTGTRLCYGMNGHWSCGGDAAAMSQFLRTSPAQMIKALNANTHLRASGRRIIHGQLAAGYSFTLSLTNFTEHGVYWLDPSTKRPIEMDSTGSITIGKKTSSTTSTIVLSHWNDPSLAIPRVPALG